MKRKLLLFTVLVMSLICLLAISVGAAETDEFGTIEKLSGISEKSAFGDDGKADTCTSRVVLYDGTEYHTYPTYYILSNSTTPSLSFDEINDTGKTYSSTSIIRIEVPKNTTNVKSILRSNSNLLYVYLPETITIIAQDGFNGCSKLQWINIPRDCTAISPYAFAGCSELETLDMSKAKSLKTTGSNSFQSCSSLKALNFPEGFTTFGGISVASSLASITFPSTTTSISTIQAAIFEEVVIPENVTQLADKVFDYCARLKKVTLPMGLVSINTSTNGTFYGTSKNNLKQIVYTGSEADAVVESIKTALPSATITYANHCETYRNSVHTDPNKDCESNAVEGVNDKCSKCSLELELKAHEMIKSIVYTSYAKAGVYNCTCQNNDCTADNAVDQPTDPIFTECKGYSTNGKGGINGGWAINTTALNNYNTLYSSKPIKVGVFMANPSHLGDSFLNQSYSPDLLADKTGAFTIDISSEYSNFSFFMTGFNQYEDLEIIISAYAYVEGEKVEFLQSNETAFKVSNIDKKDASLYTITYAKALELYNAPSATCAVLNDSKSKRTIAC